MSPPEWAGIGLFVVSLALACSALSMWRFIGWSYALLMAAEGLAFAGVGVAIALGKLPLVDRQPVVVSVAWAVVVVGHVGAVALWPPPGNQASGR